MTLGFVNTIRTVVDDCLFNKVEVDDLPMYAVDYIFLMLRAKSIGEEIEAEFKCNHIIDKLSDHNEDGVAQSIVKSPCNSKFLVKFNLLDSFVKFPEDYNKKCIVQLSDTVGIRLKSPSFSKFRSVGTASKGVFDITDEFIFACVDCVYDGDKVLTPVADFTLQELSEFIESFPADKISQITEFFANQPRVTLILNITCPACKNKSVVELNGLKDFFD